MENISETYQNSTYKNERTKNQSLTIQLGNSLNFQKIDLNEEVKKVCFQNIVVSLVDCLLL